MPWIEVAEPFAAPPKLGRPPSFDADAVVTIEDGWAEIAGGRVGDGQLRSVAGCHELSIVDAHIVGAQLPADVEVEVRRSTIEDGDLSQVRLRSVRGARLTGCKLVGADLSGAAVVDTVMTRCSLRLTNLRMATLQRVAFVDCVLHDVDAYELAATDVSFDGCTLELVNVDGLTADRVDLRGAGVLTLQAASNLRGCLVAEHQLPALAYSLAVAVGVDVESVGRPVDDS